MKRPLDISADAIRRFTDLALAARLAASGDVRAARAIYARYGVSHAAVELSTTGRVTA